MHNNSCHLWDADLDCHGAATMDNITRFKEHFSFLVKTEEDHSILDDLSKTVQSFEKDDSGAVRCELSIVDLDDEMAELICPPPFTGSVAADVPAGFVALAQKHNGIYYEDLGGGVIGFLGLSDDGTIESGNWEWEAVEEGDNEEYLEQLEEADIAASSIVCPLQFGQNWILYDPLKRATTGEPALLFLSHGDCELVPIPESDGLTLSQVLLRILAQRILDRDYFEEVYS